MDTYGVTPADVAAELPGLFPGGFTVATKPTLAQVTSMITTADTVVGLRVLDITGTNPAAEDKAAVLAKRYIIDWVKAQVLRIVYTGNDPIQVDAAAKPYADLARATLESIELLGEQAAGPGDAAPRIAYSTNPADRELLVTDEQLNAGTTRSRMF